MLFDTIKALCQTKDITIAQLERSVKVGNGSIRKWNETYPSADRLERVADYFGISTDFLLGRGSLSPDAQELAKIVDGLPETKRELVKQYVKMLSGS